jgi:hypothetical protein
MVETNSFGGISSLLDLPDGPAIHLDYEKGRQHQLLFA